uniref:hypothetical protein n=1 Tax=Gormaniella terricola TaxID=2904618 RepID=UPI0021CCE880|nr:hypothetical protein ODF01_pgp062 [Gormaniella terricola]UWV18241.1 hypothetical protein [Gormaniella terricola]
MNKPNLINTPVYENKCPGVFSFYCFKTKRDYISSTINLEQAYFDLLEKLNDNLHQNEILQKDWQTYDPSDFVFSILYRGPDYLHKETFFLQEIINNECDEACYNFLNKEKIAILEEKKRLLRKTVFGREWYLQYPLTINGIKYETTFAAIRAFGVEERILFDKLLLEVKKLGPKADSFTIDLQPVLSAEQAHTGEVARTKSIGLWNRNISHGYKPKFMYEGVSYRSFLEASKKTGVSQMKIKRALTELRNPLTCYVHRFYGPIKKTEAMDDTLSKNLGLVPSLVVKLGLIESKIKTSRKPIKVSYSDELGNINTFQSLKAAERATRIKANTIKKLALQKKEGWFLNE